MTPAHQLPPLTIRPVSWRRLAASPLALLLGGAALWGCAPRLGLQAASGLPVVAEVYESARMPQENLDSLASWPAQGWIVATAKSTHRLLVLAAADGRLLRTVGEPGEGPGQFRRPNGVAVVGDLLLVTERDNRRVQVFRLPEFAPLGFLGEGTLRSPYGIAAFRSARGVEVFVTDNYLGPGEVVPPPEELGERVRHFLLTARDAGVESRLVKSFGETTGEGVLHVVESIAADPERTRLLIADEADTAKDIKVYDLDGRFTGVVVGRGAFAAEPEGLALVRHGEGGFWIAADQQRERTRFLLFDRVSLRPVGAFTGTVVANTDGITVLPPGSGALAGGGLVAVNSDASVAAFSLADIQRALVGAAGCGTAGAPRPAGTGVQLVPAPVRTVGKESGER